MKHDWDRLDTCRRCHSIKNRYNKNYECNEEVDTPDLALDILEAGIVLGTAFESNDDGPAVDLTGDIFSGGGGESGGGGASGEF